MTHVKKTKLGKRTSFPVRIVLIVIAILVTSCSTNLPKPAYKAEKFSTKAPFSMSLSIPPDRACEAAQRSLLSQGYQLETGITNVVHGKKYFQPQPDHQLTLDITMVCLPAVDGAIIYANAVQSRYDLKTSATNTGVSVSGIGSISLPWSSDKEAMVKVAEETVTDPDFYERLFSLVSLTQK